MGGAVLSLGLLLGLRHALEPDHLAAVAALASGQRRRREVVRIALFWGCGHAGVLLAAGVALAYTGAAWPPAVARALELIAGAVLVALGVDVLRRASRGRARTPSRGTGAPPPSRGPGASRALVVGGVHGLEGSGAVVLLVLPSVRAPLDAIVYLGAFGVGTVVGMLACSAAVTLPLGLAARWLGRGGGALQLAVGLFSVAVGALAVSHALDLHVAH